MQHPNEEAHGVHAALGVLALMLCWVDRGLETRLTKVRGKARHGILGALLGTFTGRVKVGEEGLARSPQVEPEGHPVRAGLSAKIVVQDHAYALNHSPGAIGFVLNLRATAYKAEAVCLEQLVLGKAALEILRNGSKERKVGVGSFILGHDGLDVEVAEPLIWIRVPVRGHSRPEDAIDVETGRWRLEGPTRGVSLAALVLEMFT